MSIFPDSFKTFRGNFPFVVVNLAGLVAFALPFILNSQPASEPGARAADAPWLLALLVPLLLGVAIAEASTGRLDAKAVALLGVLSGLAALMRIPISFAGANLMFFLPIVGGFVFGIRFGFLLGALAMAASAAITGGIGPWLPFQMWAAGWVGAGAGVLTRLGERLTKRPVISVIVLAAYGYAAGLLFGAVMNLYFWPLASVPSDIGWSPGLGVGETVEHYWRFYLLTSLAYDAFRGLGNAALIFVAGIPVIDVLRRYQRRFTVEIFLPLDASGPSHDVVSGFRRAIDEPGKAAGSPNTGAYSGDRERCMAKPVAPENRSDVVGRPTRT